MDKKYEDLNCFSRETAYAIVEALTLMAKDKEKKENISCIAKALKRL